MQASKLSDRYISGRYLPDKAVDIIDEAGSKAKLSALTAPPDLKEIEKNENTHVAKIKKVTNGFDIYLAPQKSLRSIGNKLQNRFGGQLTISTKLHTKSRITSRDLYRVNMLFRIPKFKKGDIIEYKGDKIKIMNIQKKVFAKDIKTGKKLIKPKSLPFRTKRKLALELASIKDRALRKAAFQARLAQLAYEMAPKDNEVGK